MTRRIALLLPILAALVLLPAVAATAQPTNGPWSVEAFGAFFSPSGGSFPAGDATYTLDEDGTGFGLAVNLRLARSWSVEAGALFVDLDNDFRLGTLADTETMGVEMFWGGVDWHFAPGARLDPTLGVFVAETSYEDVIFLTEAGRRDKFSFDDDYGFGLKVGIDLPLGRSGNWYLTAEARYLQTILEGEVAGQDLDLDPVLVAVGFGYRF